MRYKRPLLALTSLALLTACGGGADAANDSAGGTPVKGGTLRIAFWDDAQGCIDPNQVYWIESRSLNRQFADSLTDQDPETGKIVPWLATSWEVNDDATSYTFKLRNDVTFSDGTKFDATAVKTAYDATHALGAKSLLGLTYTAGYKSTEVVDDYTVKVDFEKPNSAFLQASSTTTMAILSPKTYEQTPEERCTGKNLVGSGAFTLDSYTAATEAKLSRRDGYAWPSELIENQGDAYLDAIEVSYIKEDGVRVGSLTSGSIDIAWPRLPISEADQKVIEATGAGIESRSLPGISSSLIPNVSAGKPLADEKVRQALQKSIDRKSYASTVFWDGYPVVSGPFDETTPYATDSSSALAYDPEGAKALLDEAGWTAGADGYRAKDGKPLTLTIPVQTTTPGDQLVQDQLKQVGIKVDLKVLTLAQYQAAAADGGYDLLATYYTRADPSVLGSVLDSEVSQAGTAQLSQTADVAPQISGLFAEGLQDVDEDKRASTYADLQKLIVEQGVMFPLYERVQTAGVAAKVHGFAWTSEAFLRANDIWISQ
ncbi:ABC transporter substrate-binding protein [Kineosporia sp. NBRC 101677]|uniref:ABC transporter substrate-binding protein n=1 Tax=Kineosporia sp. NBRC 101677 TaxID=3032197 RepID=UPI0024A1D643|nr:ABC transporter substrate-binding protein [Kineosporia sp. NBRC 101677]GLY17769.1 ABC transporter substrate-binding protein [Kineosporia sp. NBRC 101677]